ncbi:hypothetical protein EJ110_NYTH15738 [Nymphaea thermarum]|nr:hypothetical protein EJ110_NYTH15738 [Nymphaea thermarum]
MGVVYSGFKEVNRTCCITSGFGCLRASSPCKERSDYMYFDGAHFTEALYKHLARKVYLSELPEECEARPSPTLPDTQAQLRLKAGLVYHQLITALPSYRGQEHITGCNENEYKGPLSRDRFNHLG